MLRRVGVVVLGVLGAGSVLGTVQASPTPAEAGPTARNRGVVTGRVADATGAGVADLQVRLVVRSHRGRPDARETRTVADGKYRVDDVPPGDVTAFVADRGWVARGMADYATADAGPIGRSLRAGATESIDLVVERGARIVGHVKGDDGAPVSNVQVSAAPTDAPSAKHLFALPTVMRATEADGGFVFEGLVPGLPYDVRVLPVGAPSVEHPRILAGRPESEGIAIRLPRLRGVGLVVLEESSLERPVAGATVRVRRGTSGSDRGLGLEVRTDLHGRAQLSVPLGEVASVEVRADGWATTAAQPVPERSELVVRLEALRTITGRVVHADETPAAGVDVILALGIHDHAETHTARTGQDGGFTLEKVSPGEFLIAADQTTPTGERFGAMAFWSSKTNLRLTLASVRRPSRAPVHVQVVDASGSRVSRASVLLRTPGGVTMSERMEAGRATFDLDDPAIDARMDDSPVDPTGAFVQVSDAEDEEGVALPLGLAVFGPLTAEPGTVQVHLPPERVLAGRVRGPQGEPVAGARVRVGADSRGSGTATTSFELRDSVSGRHGVRTDARGEFRVHGLPDGALHVTVEPPLSYVPTFVRHVPHETAHLEIPIPRAGRAEITVTDPSGAPMVGVQVCASSSGTSCSADSPLTDARGVAVVTGLREGERYTLRVDPSSEYLVWTVVDWAPASTTVRVERAYELSGVVRTPDGTPIEAAFVQHSHSGTEWWARSTQTDAEGRFRFQRLKPGALTLSAELGDRLVGLEHVPGPVTLRSVSTEAGARDVVLVLDPGRRLEVVPPAGTPDGAEILFRVSRQEHLLRRRLFVRPKQRLTVSGLLPEDRITFFMPPDASGRVVIHTATADDSPIRLTRGGGKTIRGRVVLPEGVVGLRLQATEERLDLTLDVPIEVGGRYELHGVPEGSRWTLRGRAEGRGARYEDVLERLPPGDAPDLVLASPR